MATGPKTDTGFDLDMSEVNAGMTRLARTAGDEAPQLVREVSEAIISEAQRLTPIDTGFLVNSAKVEPVNGHDFAHDLGFNAQYAAAVHEREDLRHTQGEHGFLRKAIEQHASRILAQQTENLRRRLGT